MDNASKDVVIYIMGFLDLPSLLRFSIVGRRYWTYQQSERLWKRLARLEFGAIKRSDVSYNQAMVYRPYSLNMKPSWSVVYRLFYAALKLALKHESSSCWTTFANRKQSYPVGGPIQGIPALLFRRPDASMVIPMQTPLILPRRGDTLVSLVEFGYRNDGISFWNGTHRVGYDYTRDDHGSVPTEFSYPEFPCRYFYCGHGSEWNVKLSHDNIKEIYTKDTLTLPGLGSSIRWHKSYSPQVGDTVILNPYGDDDEDEIIVDLVTQTPSTILPPL